MNLAAMRYKDYVWPHNPRIYTIEYERKIGARKVPFGRYFLQDLGPTRRIMRGEGEFVGEDAYPEFKRLASVFYQDGPGLLVHPVWQTSNAYFVELSLKQEPKANYVLYSFAFWEGYEGHNSGIQVETVQISESPAPSSSSAWHTVRKGDTLWAIAQNYGLTLTALINLNPQIKNPNLILVGEKVRVA